MDDFPIPTFLSIIFTLTLQESRMPQIYGVKGEAAPPGRGRRTLDNKGDVVSLAFPSGK